MKQVRNNKRLDWRSSYGKPFVSRKRLAKIRCASVCATASHSIGAIKASLSADRKGKGIAIAEVYISANTAILNILTEANKGFVK